MARLTLSYLCNPSEQVHLDDPDYVRALVVDFVLPGVTRTVQHIRICCRRRRSLAMTTNMELIGRDEINDLEAILSVCNTDADAIVARGQGRTPTRCSPGTTSAAARRSSSSTRRPRRRSGTSPPTSTGRPPVDQVKLALENMQADQSFFSENIDLEGTPFEKWAEKEWIEFGDRVPELAALAVHAR